MLQAYEIALALQYFLRNQTFENMYAEFMITGPELLASLDCSSPIRCVVMF